MKSVILFAGMMKRKDINQNEEVILVKAIKFSNIPKFLEKDIPVFFNMINEIFPNIEHELDRDDIL